jgi:hypothetical protein
MKVQADTINGIYMVGELTDFNAPEIVPGDVFIRSLCDLAEGEELAAELSFRHMRTILRYGYAIKRNKQ